MLLTHLWSNIRTPTNKHCQPTTLILLFFWCSKTWDITCLIPWVLLPCQRLTPTFPTMQLCQFSRLFCSVIPRATITSGRDEEQRAQQSLNTHTHTHRFFAFPTLLNLLKCFKWHHLRHFIRFCTTTCEDTNVFTPLVPQMQSNSERLKTHLCPNTLMCTTGEVPL